MALVNRELFEQIFLWHFETWNISERTLIHESSVPCFCVLSSMLVLSSSEKPRKLSTQSWNGGTLNSMRNSSLPAWKLLKQNKINQSSDTPQDQNMLQKIYKNTKKKKLNSLGSFWIQFWIINLCSVIVLQFYLCSLTCGTDAIQLSKWTCHIRMETDLKGYERWKRCWTSSLFFFKIYNLVLLLKIQRQLHIFMFTDAFILYLYSEILLLTYY